MTFEEIIVKIPEQFQDIARRYLPTLAGMGEEELVGWIELISSGDWQAAYRTVVQRMDTQEQLAELDRINSDLEQLNYANAEYVKMQKEMLKAILLAAAAWVKSELIS